MGDSNNHRPKFTEIAAVIIASLSLAAMVYFSYQSHLIANKSLDIASKSFEWQEKSRKPNIVATIIEQCNDNKTTCFETVIINNTGGRLRVKTAQVDMFMTIDVNRYIHEQKRLIFYKRIILPVYQYFGAAQPTGNEQNLLFNPIKARFPVSQFQSVRDYFKGVASSEQYFANISPNPLLTILFEPEDTTDKNQLAFQYHYLNHNFNSTLMLDKDHEYHVSEVNKNIPIAVLNNFVSFLYAENLDGSKLWNFCKNNLLEEYQRTQIP